MPSPRFRPGTQGRPQTHMYNPQQNRAYNPNISSTTCNPNRVPVEPIHTEMTSPQNEYFSQFLCEMMGSKYVCKFPQCAQMTFMSYDALRQHQMSAHADSLYKCEVCHKGFSQKRYVQQHMKVVHTGRQRLTCNICGKTYSAKQTLLKHVQSCHGNQQ